MLTGDIQELQNRHHLSRKAEQTGCPALEYIRHRRVKLKRRPNSREAELKGTVQRSTQTQKCLPSLKYDEAR